MQVCAGHVDGCPPLFVDGVGIRAGVEKQLHQLVVLLRAGVVEGGLAVVIRRVYGRTVLQKGLQ